jgi:SAM-dependent methyltransferase
MNETWLAEIDDYKGMVARHRPLWSFVEKLVYKYRISSIVDVGGGMGYARRLCSKYAIFDLNPKMVGYLKKEGVDAYLKDFTEADIASVKNYELVLILAIVEHTGRLEDFLKKALEINPKFILVSFFKGLQHSNCKFDVDGKRILQLYSKKDVDSILAKLHIKEASIGRIPTEESMLYSQNTVFDDILLISRPLK